MKTLKVIFNEKNVLATGTNLLGIIEYQMYVYSMHILSM